MGGKSEPKRRFGLVREEWVQLPVPVKVMEGVISHTERALVSFKDPDDGRHEGLVYWTGQRLSSAVLVTGVIVPKSVTSPGSVHVSAGENARAIAQMAARGEVLIAQVHSHPPLAGARHSAGDDHLILLPFEGLISIVVPDYAVDGMKPLTVNGFHLFSDRRWRQVAIASVAERVVVLSTLEDLR